MTKKSKQPQQTMTSSEQDSLVEVNLEDARQEIIAQAVDAAPRVLTALVTQGIEGDVQAARLVLSVAGFHQQNGGGSKVNIANAINISSAELERLKADYDIDYSGRRER